MNNTVEIQDSMRGKIARLLHRRFGRSMPYDHEMAAPERQACKQVADDILAIPEIEAGIGLYLASIEEREPS